ncbi:MAG TPA: SNF2 helicase-associated domain-containing protein, partial [Ktedonobacteraceae bacterium]|nr:SNF2 helicase-associated domain-containing protein [Ktedonobacteraceae bacterium]
MIVLHALWDNRLSEKLHLWAEVSNLLLASATKRAGRQAEVQPSHQHPYGLSYALLREAINELAGSMQLQSATPGTLTLLLPSTSKEPASSPELILEKELSDSKVVGLKPWDVATLSLDPGLALDFLLHLPNYPPHHVAFGDSLRFWAEAAKFSLALLTRQSYMPTLEETAQKGMRNFRAAWRTVLVGEDTERLSVLAKAIPPLCWSFLPADEMRASAIQNIVQSFLDATVDAFVRESLFATSLLPGNSGRSRQTKPRSLQEQWLQALTSHDATLTATPAELQLFSEKLQSWLHQLQPTEANAAFRTCFRLDAPGEDHNNLTDWHISFYLQANDDRSLLVPAQQVWQERSNTLTFLKRSFENPQERILADLGKASRLFPTLEESLKTARPMGLKLDTEQAYSFLRESAPLLEQSGFGVLVPPWWSKPTARLGVKLKVKPKAGTKDGSGLLGLQNIIDYDWTIAVGDSTLTFEEFASLVDLKVPLIKIRGQWVELRPEEIEAAIAFFKKKHGQGEMTLGDALRIGLGQGTSELGLPVMDIEGSGWLKEILAQLTEGVKITTIKQPSSLHGQLRPYQLKGVSWLAFLEQYGFGACLADDMGLG